MSTLGFILALVAGCAPSSPTPIAEVKSEAKPPPGMIRIAAGKATLGSTLVYPDEEPVHEFETKEFWMDETEVTNRQFAEFVKATGYKTVAERTPKAEDYPDAPPEKLKAGSAVFHYSNVAPRAENILGWWSYVNGACWNHPDGPKSDINDRLDYPVAHVAHEDALAYAKWAGKDLPTADEWEYAARGGLKQKKYVWGDTMKRDGKWMANTWQGTFPRQNTKDDGFVGSAPVRTFPPNGFGLYEVGGNVWEWTKTPSEPIGGQETFVTKGGSFLCADNYCKRYRPAAVSPVTADTSAAHVGFRCVWRPLK